MTNLHDLDTAPDPDYNRTDRHGPTPPYRWPGHDVAVGSSLQQGPLSDAVVRSDQLLRELSEADQCRRVSYIRSCPVVRLSPIVDVSLKFTVTHTKNTNANLAGWFSATGLTFKVGQ